MQPVNSDIQRIMDQFDRLGYGTTNPGQPDALPTPHEFAVGRGNPALADLRRRPQRNARQTGVVTHLEQFYSNTETPRTNASLYSPSSNVLTGGLSEQDLATARRRASFLLNAEAMKALPEAIQDVPREAGIIGLSTATIEVNAILSSIKSQSEHVMAAALEDARNGNRLCPLTLSVTNFPMFMTLHARVVREIVDACALPQPGRDRALRPLLEQFSQAYFAYSRNYPGAPRIRPDEVQVKLKSGTGIRIATTFRGKIIAKIAIDPAEVEQFCRSPALDATEGQDGFALLRSRMMRGFEAHPMPKKRAAFYVQQLLSNLSELQEELGTGSANKPQHGAEAQRAARRTIEELSYAGSPRFGDRIEARGAEYSDRELATYALRIVPQMDRAFQRQYGMPLISSPAVGAWAHTPAFQVDQAALREPSVRLSLQVAPITGRFLQSMPEFAVT